MAEMIVVEGIEGAGKSTAIQAIEKVLRNQLGVVEIVKTREPGGTPIAEKLRDILKHGEGNDTLTTQTEVLLMYASRSQLLNSVIKPALSDGKWVISDRHNLSSIAYQGGGRGVDFNVLDMLSRFTMDDFSPSLTLYIDVSPELGLSRVSQRGKKDRIEKEDIVFFERVREVYLAFAEKDPNIITIDGRLSIEEVDSTICNEIVSWYEQR